MFAIDWPFVKIRWAKWVDTIPLCEEDKMDAQRQHGGCQRRRNVVVAAEGLLVSKLFAKLLLKPHCHSIAVHPIAGAGCRRTGDGAASSAPSFLLGGQLRLFAALPPAALRHVGQIRGDLDRGQQDRDGSVKPRFLPPSLPQSAPADLIPLQSVQRRPAFPPPRQVPQRLSPPPLPRAGPQRSGTRSPQERQPPRERAPR